jgi:hypothetical protein
MQMRVAKVDAAKTGGSPASQNMLGPDFRQGMADRRNAASRQQLLQRVRAEFEEFPGVKLTVKQAQRLFGIRQDVCERVLDSLVRDGFMRRNPDGCYGRRQSAL